MIENTYFISWLLLLNSFEIWNGDVNESCGTDSCEALRLRAGALSGQLRSLCSETVQEPPLQLVQERADEAVLAEHEGRGVATERSASAGVG